MIDHEDSNLDLEVTRIMRQVRSLHRHIFFLYVILAALVVLLILDVL